MTDKDKEYLDDDVEKRIMAGLVKEIERRVSEDGPSMTAAEMEFVRKFLNDQAVTLASVKAGKFGDRLQKLSTEAEGSHTVNSDFVGDDNLPVRVN